MKCLSHQVAPLQRFRQTGPALHFAAILLVVSSGCTQALQRPQPGAATTRRTDQKNSQTVNRSADHYEWVKRLMATPPESAVQQASASANAAHLLPIPIDTTTATDGKDYALLLDQSSGLVWLKSRNRATGLELDTHGPWKSDQPDAAHLLHSLTTQPTSQP